VGCDPAEPFIATARSLSRDGRASFVVAGAGALPRREGGYGSITSLLALNFFPEPAAAVDEMRSLAARRGTVSACVWDYADTMEMLRRFWDAAGALDAAAVTLDEASRFPICRPEALLALFRRGGLQDVSCEPIEVSMEFAGFDDFWRPLLGGTGPAPAYVASLDEDRRTALVRELERTLPRAPGGTIALTAGAFAVRGLAP
jgi:hypothetical protein